MLIGYVLSEVHSGAQTADLSSVRHVQAEPLLIASRCSLAGRECGALDITHRLNSGALGGLR